MATTAVGDTAMAEVEALRKRLDHPVIDGDGHLVEPLGLYARTVDRVGGEGAGTSLYDYLRRVPLTSAGDASTGDQRSAWWGTTNRARDLATCVAPRLLADRMEEIGLDFAVLYPTFGLELPTIPDAEPRRLACRALNVLNAEVTADHQDRMAVAVCIPMHTPEEAVAELEFCVKELGFKVAMIPAGVARPWPAHPDAFPTACFMDRYGLDSHHDYDAVWNSFVEMKVAVTAHGAVGMRYMECGHRSPTNYMANHIGGHAFQQTELCKALVMGGVIERFPSLRFGFLEGGAGWASDLLGSLEEHWEKRNGAALSAYDPDLLDRDELTRLLADHGLPNAGRPVAIAKAGYADPCARDEFVDAGINDEHQLEAAFGDRLFFGCEADDRSVFRALDGRGNPFGLRLNAFFSSDIGHWDVPDIGRVLLESRHLVDSGLLDETDYRDFVFTNPARLHAGMNPHFFEGTTVEKAVAELLGADNALAPA